MTQFRVGDYVKCPKNEDYPRTFQILKVSEDSEHTKWYHVGLNIYGEHKIYHIVKQDEMKMFMSGELTADEMFAELGYSYQYEFGGFGYVGHQYKWKQPCNGAEKILLFNDIDKELQVHNETDYHLSPNEIKAIYKKEEELGWI